MIAIARKGAWMQLHSGVRFYPIDPRPEDIRIEDIAHALSLLCRFGGHVREHYSVAQHSIIVAHMLPPRLQLAGLLHDATEAYLVDVPRPIKVALPGYKELEDALSGVISFVYGVDFSDPLIKRADNVALLTEARDLLSQVPDGWGYTEEPAPFRIMPIDAQRAEAAFLKMFHDLTRPRVAA